jgi:GT2 family glycosyltransferase
MIAFGVCVADEAKFRRCAVPGVALACEPDSVVAETSTATSILEAYNEILDALAPREDLEALVLLHEDTEILDPGFCARVRDVLADPEVAVAGPIGARGVAGLAWWEGTGVGRVLESRGTIDFGATEGDVDAVDGLLLVLSPWTVRHLRFDAERFSGFHAYDVDLCFQARAAGRRVRAAELAVMHHTKGGLGDEQAWRRADEAFRSKWRPGHLDLASSVAA